MARKNSHRKKQPTRKKPSSFARGIFEANSQGYGFVKTAEGEYFIPARFTNTAFDGDLVEVSRIANRDDRNRRSGRKGSSGYSRLNDNRTSRGSATSDKVRARIVKVIDRAHETLIGKYEVAGPFGIVVPDDARIHHDIFTLRRENEDIPDGSIVKVRIVDFPTKRSAATGEVIEIIGESDSRELSTLRLLSKYGIQVDFPEEALNEARECKLDISAAIAEGYRDIRDRYVFTIDPDDAKDFDDALSIEEISLEELKSLSLYSGSQLLQVVKKSITSESAKSKNKSEKNTRTSSASSEGSSSFSAKASKAFKPELRLTKSSVNNAKAASEKIYRLGVHIADVSHYVSWQSSLDLEARNRATSVYLADRVIPMLPEELSNGLCSLRPNEDRLCMTCDLYITDKAELIAYDLYPAIMRSRRRLTYNEALRIIERDGAKSDHDLKESSSKTSTNAGDENDHEISWRLLKASQFAKNREKFRLSQGGLDFETKEAKVELNKDGEPIGIIVREKNDATELIEEAMIFANEVVASHLFANGWPCVYRDHEAPALDSLEALVPILQEFKWVTRKMIDGLYHANPYAMQDILEAVSGRPESEMITMLFLRAMMRAQYLPTNDGHFGLGLKAYCHFTSPIRRYPDLMVHRMLRAELMGRPEKFDQERSAINWICEHSSEAERNAETASFESQKIKICEYMQRFIGKKFSGLVSGVANYGLYIRLDNCAEGLLPIRLLGDEYFIFNDSKNTLLGSDSNTLYRLGDRLEVVLISSDPEEAKIDFALA